MKIYTTTEKLFDIEVLVCPIAPYIAAAYKGYELPEGVVIDGDKDARITEQMAADYEDFIEALESLLVDTYHLILIYKNQSEDYSRYFSFLAQDEEGNIKFRFRLRLRVSNHKAKRSAQSQKHKKEEEQSPQLQELLNGRPLPSAYPKTIIVNNKEYNTYEEAFIDIDSQIEQWVGIMLK